VVNEGEDAGVEVAFKCNKEGTVDVEGHLFYVGVRWPPPAIVVEALANAKEAIVQPKRTSTI
jgi:hypothetical protein